MKKELYFYKGKLRTPEQLLNHKDCSKGINLTRLKNRLRYLQPKDALDKTVVLKYPYRGKNLSLIELFNHPRRNPDISYQGLKRRLNANTQSVELCVEGDNINKVKALVIDYYGVEKTFKEILNMPDTKVSRSALHKRLIVEAGEWDVDKARKIIRLKSGESKSTPINKSSGTIKYPFEGKEYTSKELSKIGNGIVTPSIITKRLRRQKGWSVELAFTTPSELSRSEILKIKSTIHPDDVYRYGKDLESYIAMKKEKLRIKNIMSVPQSECSQYTSYLRYERTQENMIDREYVLGTL